MIAIALVREDDGLKEGGSDGGSDLGCVEGRQMAFTDKLYRSWEKKIRSQGQHLCF